MAIFGNMSIPVKTSIQDLTPTAVARAMNLPISTVFRWMTEDRIPGKGRSHEWRVREFEAAVMRMKAQLHAKPKKKAA